MTDGRDFVQETAELNAQVLDLVRLVEEDAEAAISRRGVDELVGVLRDAVLLLGAVARDLTRSRAEGAVEYETNQEFRRVVDEVARDD